MEILRGWGSKIKVPCVEGGGGMHIFWNYALIFLLSSEVVTLATPVMVTISPGTQLSTKRNKTK